jgi:retron-type reverse transcriptase
LRQIRETWTGTVWFIEGDTSDCFGSVDHDVLMQILGEKIGDQHDWQYQISPAPGPV